MKKNQVLHVARVVTKIFMGLLIGFYGMFMALLFATSISPEMIPYQVIFTHPFEAGWGIGGLEFCEVCAQPDDVLLSQLGIGMKLWIAIRSSLFFVLAYLMIQKVLLILQTKETFYASNIEHFKQLAVLSLLAFGLSVFNISNFNGDTNWHFTIAFGPLAISIASLVLSEIFKEGKLLLEDKNSIV